MSYAGNTKEPHLRKGEPHHDEDKSNFAKHAACARGAHMCMCMYGFRDAPKGSDHVSFRFQRILFFCFLFFSLAIASSALGVAMLLSSATVPITYDYLRIMVQTNAVDW